MALFLSANQFRKIFREVLQEELQAHGLKPLEKNEAPITTKLDKVMKTQDQVEIELKAANDIILKIRAEQETRAKEQADLITKQTALIDERDKLIQMLKDELAAGNATPGVEAALAALEKNLEDFDATIPDPAPTPENPA